MKKINPSRVKTVISEILQSYPDGRKILAYLNETDFFEAPASTKYHHSFKGGLAQHSWEVAVNALTLISMHPKKMKIKETDVFTAAICHDLCKVGVYTKTMLGYKANYPQDHGFESLDRLIRKIGIKPSRIVQDMIAYHMGMYSTHEYREEKGLTGEYGLGYLINIFNKNEYAKLIYIADELSGMGIDFDAVDTINFLLDPTTKEALDEVMKNGSRCAKKN